MIVYYHPSCTSSYRLITSLRAAGRLGEVRLVNTAKEAQEAVRQGVISVPFVIKGGKAVLTDPVEAQEVIALLDGRKLGKLTLEQAADNFVHGVLASGYADLAALVHGSLLPFASGDFAVAASKLAIYEADFGVKELEEYLRGKSSELYEANEEQMRKIAAYNLVRMAFWAGLGPDLSEREIRLLLLSRSSLGRVGVPFPPSLGEGLVSSISQLVRERGQRYYERISDEQGEITSDPSYAEFLRRRVYFKHLFNAG